MMSVLVRSLSRHRPKYGLGFAAKVIGAGLFAGIILTYCNLLLDAWLGGIH